MFYPSILWLCDYPLWKLKKKKQGSCFPSAKGHNFPITCSLQSGTVVGFQPLPSHCDTSASFLTNLWVSTRSVVNR